MSFEDITAAIKAIECLKRGIPASFESVAQIRLNIWNKRRDLSSEDFDILDSQLSEILINLPTEKEDVVTLIDLLTKYYSSRFLDTETLFTDDGIENDFSDYLMFHFIIEKMHDRSTPWSEESLNYLLKQDKDFVKLFFSWYAYGIETYYETGAALRIIKSLHAGGLSYEKSFKLLYDSIRKYCPYAEPQIALSFLEGLTSDQKKMFDFAWENYRAFVLEGLQLGASENLGTLSHLADGVIDEEIIRNDDAIEAIKGKKPFYSDETMSLREYLIERLELPF